MCVINIIVIFICLVNATKILLVSLILLLLLLYVYIYIIALYLVILRMSVSVWLSSQHTYLTHMLRTVSTSNIPYDICSDIYSDMYFDKSIWHIFWHSILHSIWHSLWHFSWHVLSMFIWVSVRVRQAQRAWKRWQFGFDLCDLVGPSTALKSGVPHDLAWHMALVGFHFEVTGVAYIIYILWFVILGPPSHKKNTPRMHI